METGSVPVAWEPYVEVPGKSDEAAIAALEQRMAITLPEPVRATIRDHAGDAAEPSGVKVGRRSETTFGAILYPGGQKDHQRYTYSIESVLVSLAEWSGVDDPARLKLFPFATNTATGYFCLDYRQDAADPPIVFVDFNYDFGEEGAVLPVAASLPELFDRLQ